MNFFRPPTITRAWRVYITLFLNRTSKITYYLAIVFLRVCHTAHGNVNIKLLYSNWNIVVGGSKKIGKQGRVLLINIFTNGNFVRFALSIFRVGNSKQKKNHEKYMMWEWSLLQRSKKD